MIGGIMYSFISLVPGQILSDISGLTKEQIKNQTKNIDLIKTLDDFDQRFIKEYDYEITQDNTDMQSVFEKRNLLVDLARDSLNKGGIVTRGHGKDQFMSKSCDIIGDESIVIVRYLERFYDLVYQNMIKSVPNELRALSTYLTDLMDDKDLVYQGRCNQLNEIIKGLIARVEELEGKEKRPVDFTLYYQGVERRFIEEKNDVYKNLVGSMSDEKSYIDAFITAGSKTPITVLSFLENWFGNNGNRVILVCGEPGHGKSLLCDKAVYDFHNKNFLRNKARNVLAVSLNTGTNRTIINDKEVVLENALYWKKGKKRYFSFEDCQGALLFMDGFDEFIDEAKAFNTNIQNIYDFMVEVDDIAKSNDIYIVVLSRTMAVNDDLDKLSGNYNYYKMLPISEDQQIKWLNEHQNEYGDYRESLICLQNNKDMNKLLGVPLLFRLIVHNRFRTASTNVVELYDNLFNSLLKQRHIIKDDEIHSIENGLNELAYRMYCTDTYKAYYSERELAKHWAYAFYVSAINKTMICFFHRSFYQYFLAKFIYSKILSIDTENAEDVISLFAEREFDTTVLHYLDLMNNEEDRQTIDDGIKIMVDALAKTEAYLSPTPRFKSSDADKSRILRTQNIYRNIFFIVDVFSHRIKLPFKGGLDIMMRKFRSDGFVILSEDDDRADLKEVCLAGVYLRNSELKKADLTKADLRGADLRCAHLDGAVLDKAKFIEANLKCAYLTDAKMHETNLEGACLKFAHLENAELIQAEMRGIDLTGACLANANLENAQMRGANLKEAGLLEANLSHAFLRGADLRGAIINKTIMNGTYLRGADLTGAEIIDTDLNKAKFYDAKIDIKYKEKIDPSVQGYDSITWVSCEKGI